MKKAGLAAFEAASDPSMGRAELKFYLPPDGRWKSSPDRELRARRAASRRIPDSISGSWRNGFDYG